MPPRKSTSLPTSTIRRYMSLRLPAIVTSCTGYAMRAILDPESRGAARIIAGHAVDALPHQLGDEQAAIHQREHAVEVALAPAHDQVVRAARVARRPQPELARRIGAQHVAVEHAVRDELAIARRHALVVEWRAARAPSAGADAPWSANQSGKTCCPAASSRNDARRYWLPPRIAPSEMPDQPARDVGTNRAPVRVVVASLRAPSRRNGAFAAPASDALGGLELAPVARTCCTSSRAASRRRRRRSPRS